MLFIGGKRMLFRGKTLNATMGSGEAVKPVAYLYNGIRMPPLPEWDKEKYPYVCVVAGHKGTTTPPYGSLYLASKIEFAYNKNDKWAVIADAYYLFGLGYADDTWTYIDEDEHTPAMGIMTWANFDLLNEDGTVYLAASEPVPVYE